MLARKRTHSRSSGLLLFCSVGEETENAAGSTARDGELVLELAKRSIDRDHSNSGVCRHSTRPKQELAIVHRLVPATRPRRTAGAVLLCDRFRAAVNGTADTGPPIVPFRLMSNALGYPAVPTNDRSSCLRRERSSNGKNGLGLLVIVSRLSCGVNTR
jgi:hypothetical protein